MAQDLAGFTELRTQAYIGVDSDLPLFFVQRTRPSFSHRINSNTVLNTTIEAGWGQGWTIQKSFVDLIEEQNLNPTLLTLLDYTEPTNSTLGISSAHHYLSVDRFFMEFQLASLDLKIGRQALNWGSGFVVNPSDPFPEVLLTQPWKPRSGLNAVRIDIPIGTLNGAQLVVGTDDAFVHPRLAGRITFNFLETDWSVVGAWREEIQESIVGFDIKGTLGVGFWCEGVYHIQEDDSHTEFVAGLDSSFPVLENLILTAQYYHNESGEVTDEPIMLESREAFAPFFSGTHYIMGALSLGVHPDVSTSTLWIHNIEDGTAFVVPSLTTYITDNIEVSLSGQIPIATSGSGEFKRDSEDLVVDLPSVDGTMTPVDLGGVIPDTTLILWSRFNY